MCQFEVLCHCAKLSYHSMAARFCKIHTSKLGKGAPTQRQSALWPDKAVRDSMYVNTTTIEFTEADRDVLALDPKVALPPCQPEYKDQITALHVGVQRLPVTMDKPRIINTCSRILSNAGEPVGQTLMPSKSTISALKRKLSKTLRRWSVLIKAQNRW